MIEEESLETVKPDVVVSVDDGLIVCEPDVYTPPQGAGKTIVWLLDAAAAQDWRFADDGIAIKQPNQQFSGPGVIAGGSRFKLIDKNSDTALYAYAVNLLNRKTGLYLSVDPSIKNSGQ